jgi:hypothetical protein
MQCWLYKNLINMPNQAEPVYIKSKPIFVMRFRNSMSDGEFRYVKDTIYQSDMGKEYHIIALKNDKDKDEFEMYNADKIERQDWNELVNNILK